MEEVIKFLGENHIGFLASVDNGKPRVRPFGFMFEKKESSASATIPPRTYINS